MGIGGIKAMDSMAGRQGAAARSADHVGKSIEDEISNLQRQKQGLSSKQEMSAEEKAEKRRELQQELNSLNTRLKQRQTDVNKEQQREARRKEALADEVNKAKKGAPGAGEDNGIRESTRAAVSDGKSADRDADAAVSREAEKKDINQQDIHRREADKKADKGDEDKRAADKKDEEPEDIGMPPAEMRSIVKESFSGEQAERREAVIARMEKGLVILKGEIRQDELRGTDAEKKKAELKRQEQKIQRAVSGLPDVKGPFKARAGAEAEKEKPGAGMVRSTGDGIVIVTKNALKNDEPKIF